MPFKRDHFNGYCKGVEGNLAPPPPRPSLEDSKKINWKKEKKLPKRRTDDYQGNSSYSHNGREECFQISKSLWNLYFTVICKGASNVMA